ncbi:MAG: two-component regulator propeller domain-containing protein [Bacteroidota bacterium]
MSYRYFMNMIRRICTKWKDNIFPAVILLLPGLIIPFQISQSQEINLRFQHYTTLEDLSQNTVDCILRDKRGFMWFGTWNGLNRFDGYHFVVYKSDNQGNSLSNNFIYSLCEDTLGNLLIGTKYGLNQYDFKQDRFRNYFHDDIDSNTLAENQINAVFCDNEGFIWAGTNQNGLDKILFDYKQQKIIKIWHSRNNPGNPLSLPGNTVNAIYGDRKHDLWIGTNQGLCTLDKKTGVFRRIDIIPSPAGAAANNILSIYEDREGILWIGSDQGLIRYSRSKGHFKWYVPNPNDPGSLAHLTVNSINEDLHGNLLIGTLGGLDLYRKSTDDFVRFPVNVDKDYSLNNEFINAVCTDDQGNVWIGTDKGGINKYNVFQKQFSYIDIGSSTRKGLNNSTINSVLDESSVLWIGTAGGGLNMLDKTAGRFKYFKYSAFNPSGISSDFITSILRDNNNNLWLGTWGNGLNKLLDVRNEGRFKRYTAQTQADPIQSNFVSSLWEDKRGFLVIGTFTGLDLFYPEKEKFVHVAQAARQNRISEVGCILQDRNGDYWIGTRIGLFFIKGDKIDDDLTDKDIMRYVNIPGDPASLPGNYIISLCEDMAGNIWVGTYGNGICKITGNESYNRRFKNYTDKNGLCNNVVYAIIEDKKGNLWLSTDIGLSRFNPADSTFKNFYVTDGLQSNQFYWSAANKNSDGWLFFGGTNGLNYFNPDSIKDYNYKPKVLITDLKIFNQSIPVGKWNGKKTILSQNITETREIRLSYHENVFSFEFSALDFFLPDKVMYKYKMEGIDQDWVEVSSNRRFANYTNLKGGEYTFYVNSCNSDGVWAQEPTRLKIIITPPFWETDWFRTLAVVFLFLSFVAYYQYRTRQLQARKRQLEKLVHERTAKIEEQKAILENQNIEISEQRDKLIELNKRVQLVNQLKLRFFTNISHEFRTPLTLIMGILERFAGSWKGDDESYHLITLANRNAKRLLHLINQLMEFRKIETGKTQLKVTKGNISEYLKSIVSSFNQLAIQKQITYKLIENPASADIWFDHEKLENIVYNLISNAFKYTPEKGTITVELRMVTNKKHTNKKEEDNDALKKQIEIRVSDTGIGIPKENIQDIFKRFYRVNNSASLKARGSGIGLSITRELIRVHHGNIYVESVVGKGSTFTVHIPCNKEYFTGEEIGANIGYSPDSTRLQTEFLVEELKAENQQEIQKQASRKPSVKPVLLIVEDNQDLRVFISMSLQDEYHMLEAHDGKQGYEMAKNFSPQLIISDIMMPEMDGLELCTRIKENILTSHIPVLLLTARTSVENWIEGLESGADDYIPKPFNLSILKAKIASTIENRRKLRNLFLTNSSIDPKEIVTTTADEQFLRKSMEIVEAHYSDSEFSVEMFVEKMAVSRSLLHKKLSAIIDQSAGEFITHVRLKKSAELLKSGNGNISEIAYQVGFNDPKYFSRCFKKQFGKPPTEYSRKLK